MALLPSAWTLIPADTPAEDRQADERAWVARAQAGDAGAFRELFEAHIDAVYRFLLDLLGGDAASADEGAQETFVRAYDKLSSLRTRDRLRPWLLGIARNVSLETRRARRRTVELEEEDGLPVETTPESELMSAQELARISAALGTLKEERRAALLLRFDHGLPYEEIARVMGWSLSKAKVEVHRARLLLRTSLGAPSP
ncbi:MAG: RNA polymerase sigma factor [Myxococcaceae bacterium]